MGSDWSYLRNRQCNLGPSNWYSLYNKREEMMREWRIGSPFGLLYIFNNDETTTCINISPPHGALYLLVRLMLSPNFVFLFVKIKRQSWG